MPLGSQTELERAKEVDAEVTVILDWLKDGGKKKFGWSNPTFIGRGGMGAVFRVTCDDGPVAVKGIFPRLSEHKRTRDFVDILLQGSAEVERLSQIRNHENLVLPKRVIREEPVRAIVMDYVPGPSLREVIDHLHPTNPKMEVATSGVDENWVVEILRQIARGLGVLHAKKVVHLDIKPENILLHCVEWDKTVDADGEAGDHVKLREQLLDDLCRNQPPRGAVRITDFGVSRVLERYTRDVRSTTRLFASWAYLAPELQRPGVLPQETADVYSLGVVAYELLTGRTLAGISPPRPSEINRDVADWLDRVICQCLQGSPDLRYQKVGTPEQLEIGDANRRFLLLADLTDRTSPARREPTIELRRLRQDHRLWRELTDDQLAAAAKLQVPPAVELVRQEADLRYELVLVPGGHCDIGSNVQRNHNSPRHHVDLDPFYFGADLLVSELSWDEARRMTRDLHGRAPTSAQWEVAVGLVERTTSLASVRVRERAEWCEDDWDPRFYERCACGGGEQVNPVCTRHEKARRRVVRGVLTVLERAQDRRALAQNDPGIGVRLVLPVSEWRGQPWKREGG